MTTYPTQNVPIFITYYFSDQLPQCYQTRYHFLSRQEKSLLPNRSMGPREVSRALSDSVLVFGPRRRSSRDPGQKRSTRKKPEITAWGVNGYANGPRRELENRNFIQWRNTLDNTQSITKLLVQAATSCLFLLSSDRLFSFRTLASLQYHSFRLFSPFIWPRSRSRCPISLSTKWTVPLSRMPKIRSSLVN